MTCACAVRVCRQSVVENFADPTAQQQQQLAALRKERVATTTIALLPLQLADITELLSAALSTPAAVLTELAQEILTKTHGSPFFVHQFLGALCRDALLTWNSSTGEWQWDLGRIQTLTATDNVADFMIATLQRLSSSSLQTLQRAACIGTQFDLTDLAELCEQSPAQCTGALLAAVHVGLIMPLDNTYPRTEYGSTADGQAESPAPAAVYKFVHERVQQAAYAMLEASPRQELHLQLGRRRLVALGQDVATGKLFDVVNHLNLGSPRLLASNDEQSLLQLARLNLLAGQRAKTSAAFQAAADFFTAATTLLPASAWDSHHALMFELHYERAQAEVLVGRFAEAEAQLLALRQRSSSAVEQALVQLRLCELYSSRGEFAIATQAGIAGLAVLGIELPNPEDAQAAFAAERAAIAELIGARRIIDLLSLPLNQSPEIDTALGIIITISMPAYMIGSPLYPLLMARQITLALQHGAGERTSYSCASYGFMLAAMFNEPAEAYEFGKLALAFHQRITNVVMACRTHFALGAFMHFCEPLKDCIGYFEKAEKAGYLAGDFAYLSVTCSSRAQLFPYTSPDLRAALHDTDDYMVLMQRTKDPLATLQLLHTRQLLRALLGQTTEPTSLRDADFDEEALWPALRQADATYALNHLAWVKITLLCLFGKYAAASALGIESEPWFVAAPGIAFHIERIFWFCLALLGNYASVPETERGSYDVRIDRYHQQLRTWASSCAANYQHRERLIAAERARLAGQSAEATMLYDQAIDAAQKNGFPLHEALGHELAGRFHAAGERSRLASYYLTEALYCYLHLGATAKANALVAEYPEPLRSETRTLKGLNQLEPLRQSTTSSTGSTRGTEDHLDVNMILKAAEVISRERVLDKVIEQVLHTVLSSAGAQRGFLILDRGGVLQIEAARTLSPDSARMGLGIALDSLVDSAAPAEELAFSVVHYVVRTRQVVVLSAVAADPRFASDAYLLRVKPQAVLCLPLINQGRLTGLLYLENNLAQVTFSAARIDLLRILSAQAATALENALLLHGIKEATEKIRRTNEVLESQVAQRTAELQRSNCELQLTNQRLQVELSERSRAERERTALQEQMLQAERERARLQEQMLQAERDRAAIQEKMLHAQRERLAELATPIIPITQRIMVMPLIGAMEAERAGQLIDAALNGAQDSGAQVVILDITGLRHIDTSVADSLLKTARALRLVGAHAIVTGIRAVVAQTLVSLGVDLSSLETRSTLQSAIAHALRHTGESLVLKSK